MPIVEIKGVGKAQFPDDMPLENIRSFLRNKYSQQTMQGQSDLLAPQQQTAAPYEPTLAEKFGTKIAEGLKSTGLISDNYGAQRIGRNVTALGEFLPGIGDATAGDEFGRAASDGDLSGMAMAGLGVIPVAGDAAKKLVRVAHSTKDPGFDGVIKKGGQGNIFDGLFASYGESSNYGGNNILYDIDESKIMSMGDVDVDYDDAIDFIKKEYPDADDDTVDALYEIIAEDSNVFEMDVNPLEDYGFDDLGDASWEGQRLRGKLARSQGFDAVEMNDEFGTSILIPYGSNASVVKNE